MKDAQRRTTPRASMGRTPGFAKVSPKTGMLDEAAFDAELERDPDAAVTLLAELTGATDPALRELARRMAGRVFVRLGRAGQLEGRGVGRLRRRPLDRAEGDLDIDASLEPILLASAAGTVPSTEDLSVRAWASPRTALCLVVDRSGSMGGARLAAAALAASAVAWRSASDDYSVVAFGRDAVVVKEQGAHRPAESVVDDILSLRGHGPTDIALALRTARDQLARSTAPRQVTLLLSDGRATSGGDPSAAAREVGVLHVLAPAGDAADAAALAAAGGGRVAELAGPASIPAAIATLLG